MFFTDASPPPGQESQGVLPSSYGAKIHVVARARTTTQERGNALTLKHVSIAQAQQELFSLLQTPCLRVYLVYVQLGRKYRPWA
jgi:hypothetical protein